MWTNRRIRMISNEEGLFSGHYVDVKTLYVSVFRTIPCIAFVGEVDTNKTFDWIHTRYAAESKGIFQHVYFDYDEGKLLFNNTVFILSRKRIIEVGGGFCHILHTPAQYAWAQKLAGQIADFRVRKTEARTIGFASVSNRQ
jgi:hypothetical protein